MKFRLKIAVFLSVSTAAAFVVRVPQLSPQKQQHHNHHHQHQCRPQQQQQRRQRQNSRFQQQSSSLSVSTSYVPSTLWYSNDTNSEGGGGHSYNPSSNSDDEIFNITSTQRIQDLLQAIQDLKEENERLRSSFGDDDEEQEYLSSSPTTPPTVEEEQEEEQQLLKQQKDQEKEEKLPSSSPIPPPSSILPPQEGQAEADDGQVSATAANNNKKRNEEEPQASSQPPSPPPQPPTSSSSSQPPSQPPSDNNWRHNNDKFSNKMNDDNIIPNPNEKIPSSKRGEEGEPAYYTIPVLGPFVGQPPLLLGGELILNPPSPLQWKTITECVEVHNEAIKSLYQNATNAASLDAAPLVAILESDENDDGTDKIRGGYRYATLAAIVGVASNNQFLDTGDAIAFRQALQDIHSSSSTYFQPESRIRMVGIGRAQLSRFGTKEKETIVKNIRNYRTDGTRDWQQEEAIDAFEDGPILLARMNLMLDGPQPATPIPGLGGPANSIVINKQCSPVHALSEMSMWVSRITFMHLDRQKLVQGLQAAQVRIEMPHFADYEDHDGIGAIYDKKEQEKEIQEFEDEIQEANDLNPQDSLSRTLAAAFSTLGLEDPAVNIAAAEGDDDDNDDTEMPSPPTSVDGSENDETSTSSTYDPQRTFQEKINSLLLSYEADKKNAHKPLSPQSSQLLELANYGMGYSAASFFQPLDSSTRILMERLAPYYSYHHVASEEFYYQVFSLVALHSLQTYLQRDTITSMELLEALKSTNTVDRLKQVFDWMLEHKLLLQELARKKSQELRERGEDVADLW